MSIGFLGGGNSQKALDLFTGNAEASIDTSLQNVLGQYDSIRTDYDRLSDRARIGNYNLTNDEHYNSYLKESVTGWSYTWFQEYRAVLALRADALQKKLQASYNRVLEKSAYTKIDPNSDSVFAPYANRTFSGADVHYKSSIDPLFLIDGVPPAPPPAPPAPPVPPIDPGDWTQLIHDELMGNPVTVSDLDQDGDTFFGDDGNNATPERDPRVVWGQYIDNRGGVLPVEGPPTQAEMERAWRDNNVLPPPFIPNVYYESNGNTVPAGPVYYVETNEGSYIDNVTGEVWDWDGGNVNWGYTGWSTTNDVAIDFVPDSVIPLVNSGNQPPGSGLAGEFTRINSGSTYFGKVADESGWVRNSVAGYTDVKSDTIWIPKSGALWDHDNNGSATFDVGALRDPNNYELVQGIDAVNSHDQYTPGDDLGKNNFGFPTDPNQVGSAINPYLYDGSTPESYVTPWGTIDMIIGSGFAGPEPQYTSMAHAFGDSRMEAHAIFSKGAQVDATIKAIDDVITSQGVTDPQQISELVTDGIAAAQQFIAGVGSGGPFVGPDGSPVPIDNPPGGGGGPLDLSDSDAFIIPFGTHSTSGTPAGTLNHPWGGPSASNGDIFYLGVEYNKSSIAYHTDGWKQQSKGSLYGHVRDQLEFLASLPENPSETSVTYPGLNYTLSYAGGPDDVYTDVSATVDDADERGNYKINIPQFGTGDSALDLSYLPSEVHDTLLNDPQVTGAIQQQLSDIQGLFVGRQYDDIMWGNKYDADYWHVTTTLLPGWYGANNQITSISNPPWAIPGSIPVDGTILEQLALFANFSNIDGLMESVLGGTTVQVASTFDVGKEDWLGFSAGLPSLFYGHESAISAGHDMNLFEGIAKITSGIPGGGIIDTVAGILDAVLPDIGLPTLGVAGSHADLSVAIPIPTPAGLYSISIPTTVVTNASYDLITQMINDFMQEMKSIMAEAVQVFSYAASSGTAFDSYASRAEYHMAEPGYSEALARFGELKISFGGTTIPLVSIGKMMDDILFGSGLDVHFGGSHIATIPLGLAPSILGEDISPADPGLTYKDRLYNYKHSIQGAESRETETGAFFATSSFLSQFELDGYEHEYWMGTQQNEEVVNMDLLRGMTYGLEKMLGMITSSVVTLVKKSDGGGGGFVSNLVKGVLPMFLESALAAKNKEIVYDLLYRDQNMEGDVAGFLDLPIAPTVTIKQSHFTTEAFDYIESDHKPFEEDSNFNYLPTTSGGIGAFLNFTDGLYDYGTPDFILEGYASTRRFRKVTAGATGDYSETFTQGDFDGSGPTTVSDSILNPNSYDATTEQGYGARGQAGSNDAVDAIGASDGVGTGWWEDTALGDINEVYVGSRKVSFSNLTVGFNEFTDGTLGDGKAGSYSGSQTVSSEAVRYTGSDSRVYESRYQSANSVNHESFNVGLYTNAGEYSPNASTENADGAKAHYSRANQYSLGANFSADASGQEVTLFGNQALNPTFGGFIKIAEIDKNKSDGALLAYEGIDATTLEKTGANDINNMTYNAADQQFGAAPDGTINDLNKVLYEHLHLRADGRNLSQVKNYRDVFNMGFMNNVFITGQTYHSSGGGISSSLELVFNKDGGVDNIQSGTREDYDVTSSDYNPYYTPFLNKSKGAVEVYLINYFAHKKRAANSKT